MNLFVIELEHQSSLEPWSERTPLVRVQRDAAATLNRTRPDDAIATGIEPPRRQLSHQLKMFFAGDKRRLFAVKDLEDKEGCLSTSTALSHDAYKDTSLPCLTSHHAHEAS